MIKSEIKEILEGINATPFGRALQAFLDDKLEELNNVQNCTSWEDTLGRKHATKVLEDLFSLMKIQKSKVASKNQYT